MALYHLLIHVGRPGRAGPHAQYLERMGVYADREDLLHAESGNLPVWAQHDSLQFWNAADRFGTVNGRTYRGIIMTMPRELNDAQKIELAREFVDTLLSDRHAFTWAIHRPPATDGRANMHAHIMFSERTHDGIDRDPTLFFRRAHPKFPERGGARVDPQWDRLRTIFAIRSQWALTANRYLEQQGFESRIDERSNRRRAIEIEPRSRGALPDRLAGDGALMRRSQNRERAQRNGERLIIKPEIALRVLAADHAIFSRRDLEQLVFAKSANAVQYQRIMVGVLQLPDLVRLEPTDDDGERFTTRQFLEVDRRMEHLAGLLSSRHGAAITASARAAALAGSELTPAQQRVFDLLTGSSALAVASGAAGSGKSYVLTRMRLGLEADGQQVLGASLVATAASSLQRDTGIPSQPLPGLLARIESGEMPLNGRSTLVIDHAGQLGTRTLERVLSWVERGGAQLRLVADDWQLHEARAGASFRRVEALADAAGVSVRFGEVLRQRETWQRAATRSLAQHGIAEALAAYQAHGRVQMFSEQVDARSGLLGSWHADRRSDPDRSQLLLTDSREEARLLNQAVRQFRKDRGELRNETTLVLMNTRLPVASGDRLIFTKSDTGNRIEAGSLGSAGRIDAPYLQVRLDDGRDLTVDTARFSHLAYGYALPADKAHGITVDRAYVLATSTMSTTAAYVALTRHRDGLQIAYSRDHFSDAAHLASTWTRAGISTYRADYLPGERRREHRSLESGPPSAETRPPLKRSRQRQSETGVDARMAPPPSLATRRAALQAYRDDVSLDGLRSATRQRKSVASLHEPLQDRHPERERSPNPDRSAGIDR